MELCWRQDPWISEQSFIMFDPSSSATRSFWNSVQESLPNGFKQLNGSPCQRMLQDTSESCNMSAGGIELCFAVTPVPISSSSSKGHPGTCGNPNHDHTFTTGRPRARKVHNLFLGETIVKRAYIKYVWRNVWRNVWRILLSFFCLKRLKNKKSEEYSEVLHGIIGHMSEVSSEVLLPLVTSDEKVWSFVLSKMAEEMSEEKSEVGLK
jgi:hypothetical protein